MAFDVQKSRVGAGFDVVYDEKRMWFKFATSELQAAILGIQFVSANGGPPPSELLKSMTNDSLRKSVVEAVTSSMRKVDAPAETPVTRAEAMAYLESLIRKHGQAREITSRDAPPSPGEFYTVVSMMRSEQEFQAHRGYQQVAAEVRANRGK